LKREKISSVKGDLWKETVHENRRREKAGKGVIGDEKGGGSGTVGEEKSR